MEFIDAEQPGCSLSIDGELETATQHWRAKVQMWVTEGERATFHKDICGCSTLNGMKVRDF